MITVTSTGISYMVSAVGTIVKSGRNTLSSIPIDNNAETTVVAQGK